MRIGSSPYWIFQVVGWGAYGLINIILAMMFEKMTDPESARLVLTRMGIFLVVGFVFTHFMRALIRRLHTLQKTVEMQLAQLFFISVIFSLICGTFYTQAYLRLGLLNEGEWKFAGRSLLLIMSGGFYYFINIVIWNLIYFTYHYVTQSRKRQLDALKLESLIEELELKAMVS